MNCHYWRLVRRRESREVASLEDETGKEAGSWWDAEEAGGGCKGAASCSGDRHTAIWPRCAPGGRRKGAQIPAPHHTYYRRPFIYFATHCLGFSSAKWGVRIAPGTQQSKSLRLIRSWQIKATSNNLNHSFHKQFNTLWTVILGLLVFEMRINIISVTEES